MGDQNFTLEIAVPAGDGLNSHARNNRETLSCAYDQMLAGNPNALFDILDEEVRFFEAPSLPYAAAVQGIEATKTAVQAMLDSWQSMAARITEYLAGGDLVIAYIEVKATGDRGKFEGPVAELFRFRDRKIIEWRPIYWDTHAVRAALGAE